MKKIAASSIFFVFIFSSMGALIAQQVDKKTEQALIDAINDEYKARALYQKVIDKFGSVQPFSNIINAEATHIALLKPLFSKYGITVPEDEWYSKVPSFATLKEACEAGVQAEIENVKMYDDFLNFVAEKDIVDVFKRLRAASQEKHLPAFKRCAAAGTGQGGGRMRGK